MNYQFKTMPDNGNDNEIKEDYSNLITKKKIKSTNVSFGSKKLSKNNSIKKKMKIIKNRKNTSTKKEINKEIKNMVDFQLKKHFQQTDKTEKRNKSSFMDFPQGNNKKKINIR